MKKLNGYEAAKAYSGTERLPVGGYVLKILEVKEFVNPVKGYGDYLLISFDIAEGEQKDFYKNNYKMQTSEDKKWKGTYRLYIPKEDGTEQDGWTMRRFKTVMNAIEESNNGYHWDWNEAGLKDKLIGGIFNNKEYELNGRSGFFTNCHSLVTVEKIRSGKFTIPADTLLKNSNNQSAASGGDADFMNENANPPAMLGRIE